VRDPETRPLLDIDQRLGRCKANPIKENRRFRGHAPRGLAARRAPPHLVTLLNVSGRLRGKYFHTFCVTSVGRWG